MSYNVDYPLILLLNFNQFPVKCRILNWGLKGIIKANLLPKHYTLSKQRKNKWGEEIKKKNPLPPNPISVPFHFSIFFKNKNIREWNITASITSARTSIFSHWEHYMSHASTGSDQWETRTFPASGHVSAQWRRPV